jgi:hypothetical protein
MKTTFDLPESLVGDVKRIARARGTTARALVQQALTRIVTEDGAVVPYSLPELSVSGFRIDELPLHELVLESYDRP